MATESSRKAFLVGFLALFLLMAPLAVGQQTGSISGKVTTGDGASLPGVTVEASANVLPQVRVVTTGVNGEYRLPELPPGQYVVRFALSGLESQVRNVRVYLDQQSTVDVQMGIGVVAETITVAADSPFIDRTSTAIKSALADDEIDQLPVGQEYQDLVKLIPGVQYTEESVRGPSAGGSGQDNVYQFDGVNVGLPLFGTLSAEPSSHDIQQISVIKGGAKALDFNRAGGFLFDSVSKSGTNELSGLVSYQIQTDSMTADRDTVSDLSFEEDRDWLTLNVGGPLASDLAFFYASFYRPTRSRDNQQNLYGNVPAFDDTREELFGKITLTPTSSILLHGSYRDSDREQRAASVLSEDEAGTLSEGNDSTLNIAIGEGSWLINDNSYATFKYTDFANETSGRPDDLLDFQIAIDGSVGLDIDNLDRQGRFLVPAIISGEDAYNAFVQPLIDRYGYLADGVRVGGGDVGAATTINDQDFFRESIQLGYNYTLGTTISHDLHIGYQWYRDEEDLARLSNGWGLIEVVQPDDEDAPDGSRFVTRFQQMSLPGGISPNIHSEFESQNIELNDTILWGDWSFNVGVLLSEDTYYGQGLREDSSTISGYVAAPGNKYEMYKVGFSDQIQPRLGVTWAYNGEDTAYASFAQYNPAATSLPRAASWDRNLRREIFAYFDEDGDFISAAPIRSSSGKLFVDDMDPRRTDEYMLGTSQRITDGWSARAYARYRRGSNFWEDTNNDARIRYEPPAGIPRELYIPDLNEKRDQIGSGSSYVIAELDGAFTKFYEVSLETDYRIGPAFLRGSYTWSHYYGNFDQDNTTTSNDDNVFIGSSFIGDGRGSQLWDNRYGDLRGDRRHLLKLYGFYDLPWAGSAGAFFVYQSGQPWEVWSGTSVYAEPAGSRTTDDHYQLDLNYTHNFSVWRDFGLQLKTDIFNVTDNQTGYNIQNRSDRGCDPVTEAGCEARSFFDPRRYQVALRLTF